MRLMESHNYQNWFHYSSTQQQHLPHAKSNSNNYAKSNFFNDNKFKNQNQQNELNFGRKLNPSNISNHHQSKECSPENDNQLQFKKKKKKSPFSFQDVVKSYSSTNEDESIELLSWLEGELEFRGIDPVVYGRYVLALLQENTAEENAVDVGEKDYGSMAASIKSSGQRSLLFTSSFASQSASTLTSPSISRLCEHHQRFYPSINSRNKLSTRAKENTQKASSTTKWMHKKYLQLGQQQGVLLQSNIAKSDPGSKSCSIEEFEVDHNCPDCQRTKGFTEHRKMVVLKCLKTASDPDMCNGIEDFVDEICFKYDTWQKGETGKHRNVAQAMVDKVKSSKLLTNSSNELVTSDIEWDSSRQDMKTRSNTDLLQPSYMQSFGSINDDGAKKSSKNEKDCKRKAITNQSKFGNNPKYYTNKYPTSYSSNSSEYGDMYDKKEYVKDLEEPSDLDNNNVTGNRREQFTLTNYRSVSEDHASMNGIDEWSKQPVRQQVKFRDQALKYFAAFPALNTSSSTSSTSSTQNLNSPRSAKMSHQSSLDDSVFLETSSNSAASTDHSLASPSKAAPSESTNSWNGQKIIKNIVSKTKSQSEQSTQFSSSNCVNPVPVINSLGVSEKHKKLLTNSIGSMIKSRTAVTSTLDNFTTNFTTLKKKSLTSSVSTSRKPTDTEEKQQTQPSDNNATSTNLAPSSIATAIPSKEQEKIFNIMPSFLNPLKLSASVSSVPTVSVLTTESRSLVFSKPVKSTDTSEIDTVPIIQRSYINSTADSHHHSNYQKQSSLGNNLYGNNNRRRNQQQQQRSSVCNTTVTKSINKSLSYSDQPFRKAAGNGNENQSSGDASTSRSRFLGSTSSATMSGSAVTSTLSQPRHSNDSPSIVDLLPNFLRSKVQQSQHTGGGDGLRQHQGGKANSEESSEGCAPPAGGGAAPPPLPLPDRNDRLAPTMHTDVSASGALARQDTLVDNVALVAPRIIAASTSTVNNVPPISAINVLNQTLQPEQDTKQIDLLNLFQLLSTKSEAAMMIDSSRTSHLNGFDKFENAAASLLANDLLNNNKNINSLTWEPLTHVQQSFPANLTNMISITTSPSLYNDAAAKNTESAKTTNITFVNLDQPILSSSISDNCKSLDQLLDTYLLDRSANSPGLSWTESEDWKPLGNLSISPYKSMDSCLGNYRDNNLKRDYVSYLWNQNCTLRYMDFINDNVDIFNWLSSSKSLSDALPSEHKFIQQSELQKELSMITDLQKLHQSQRTNMNEETKPFISLENHETQCSAFSEVIPNRSNDRPRSDPLRNMISLVDISDDEEIFESTTKPLSQSVNQDLLMLNHFPNQTFPIDEKPNFFSNVFERIDLPLKTPSNCACKDNCNGHFLVSACCCAHDEYHSRLDLFSFKHSDKSTNTENDGHTLACKTKASAEFDSCLLNFDELINDVLRIADDETTNVTAQQMTRAGLAFESLSEISQKGESYSNPNDIIRSKIDSKTSANDNDECDLPPMPYSKRHKLKKKNDQYGKLPEDMIVKQPTKPSSNSTYFNGNINESDHFDYNSTTANSTNIDENQLSYGSYNEWLDYDTLANNEENQPFNNEYYYVQNGENLNSYYGSDDVNMMQLEPCGNDLYNCDGYLLNLKSIQQSTNSEETEDGNKDSNLYVNIKFKSENRSIGITSETSKQSQKPCTFYMEGFCARGDCKFSHDLASIPCKYWLEGYCLKDTLCPFLHAYPESNSSKNSKLDPNAKSFQFKIESDSDFPSLFAEDEPVSALNGITDKTNHTHQERVHFDFSKSGGLKIKMRDLSKNMAKNQSNSNYARLFIPNNKKNKASVQNSSISPDKKLKQPVVATEEEWPSLGDEFPSLGVQPVNQTFGKSSSQTSSDSTNAIKFRDKVLKSNNSAVRGNSQNQATSSTTKTMGVFPLKSVL